MSMISREVLNQKEYLVAELEDEEYLDEDCLAVVGSGQSADEKAGIEGIFPISYTQYEGRRLRYDTNTYVPFTEYKKQIRRAEALCKVFLSILDTYKQAESYLLDPACFLLKQEYVYVEQKNKKAWLIIYPVYDAEGKAAGESGNLQGLFRNMLRGIRLSEEDMAFYGNLTYELDREETFNIVLFRRFLTERGNQKSDVGEKKESATLSGTNEGLALVSETHKRAVVSKEESLPVFSDLEPPAIASRQEGRKFLDIFHNRKAEKLERDRKSEKAEQKKIDIKTGKKPAGGIRLPDDEELPKGFHPKEQSILEDFVDRKDKNEKEKAKKGRGKKKEIQESRKGTGTFLPVEQTDDEPIGIPPTDDEYFDKHAAGKKLYLRQSDTGESISVRRFPFVIGREGSGLTVDASKTKVSRQHAVIKETEDGFTIRDISKLGTFLDGERIAKNEDIPLKDGMNVLLKEIAYDVIIEGQME